MTLGTLVVHRRFEGTDSIFKVENKLVHSSETSVAFYQTVLKYISEDASLHGRHFENVEYKGMKNFGTLNGRFAKAE
jgi:hypothetical protein